MSDTDTQIGKTLQAADWGSTPMTDAPTEARRRYRRTLVIHVADGANAATAPAFVSVPIDGKAEVKSAKWSSNTAVTASATAYKTITLAYNNANGGSYTTIGTLNLGATAVTAEIPVALTLNASNVVMAAGSQLCVSAPVTGAGLVIGTGKLTVVIEEE